MAKMSEMLKMSPGEFFSSLRASRKPVAPSVIQPSADTQVPGGPVYNAALPNVDLLPDEYAERVRANQSIIYFVLAFILLAVITGLAAAGGSLANLFHQTQLQQSQSVGQSLQKSVTSLQGYATYRQNVDSERTLMATALKGDINMPSILSSISSNANRYNVSFTTVSLTVNGATTGGAAPSGNAACAADPFTSSNAIGCISLNGTAPNYASASQFFAKLNTTKGFANGTLSTQSNSQNSVGGAAGYSFQGSVAITSDFYSNKYNSLTVPLEVLLGTSGAGATGTSATAAPGATTAPTVAASGIPTVAATRTPTTAPTSTAPTTTAPTKSTPATNAPAGE